MPEPIRAEAPAPMMDAPPEIMDQKVVQYDEVGYANRYPDESIGQPTAVGVPYHPSGYTAAHVSLPLGTFVEVTHLDTGRTVLLVVNDNRAERGSLIQLSDAAASTIGVNETAPVRVRRVNPPDQEKAALSAGQKGGDRLDTPPQLLTALRKKLGAGPISPQPVQTAALPQSYRTPPASAPSAEPVQSDDGFVVEEEGQWSAPPPVRSAKAAKPAPSRAAPAAKSWSSDDGFVVEDAGRTRAEPARPSGKYFVQIAAFSDASRAKAAANRAGAGLEHAGNVWRVKKGPYASEAQARSALGQAAANGYRDARITR